MYACCNTIWLEVITMDKETTIMSIRVDKKLKKQSEELFKDLGLNTSAAINMFLTQCVREDSIPFEVSRRPSKELQEALEEAEEIKKDKSRRGLNSIRELMDELNK